MIDWRLVDWLITKQPTDYQPNNQPLDTDLYRILMLDYLGFLLVIISVLLS